jgi:porin
MFGKARGRFSAQMASRLVAGCLATAPLAAQARADETARAASLKLEFTSDIVTVPGQGSRYLDNLTSSLHADLGAALGLRGATLFLEGTHTYSNKPNELVGAVQGVDRLDVRTRHVRLSQAWLEQDLDGHGSSFRFGVYDPEREFAVLPAAADLINPGFSLPPELASSGGQGAPRFPSTALGARLRLRPAPSVYLQVAALNATAGTIGDKDGLDTSFQEGVLVVSEVGWAGVGKAALGAWRFTRRQRDASIGPAGPPRRTQWGLYALGAAPLSGLWPGHDASVFTRLGVSDGHSTPYRGSWQAGLRLQQPIAGRPDSSLSLGLTQAVLSADYVRRAWRTGLKPFGLETVFEAAYSDRLSRRLTLQPDLQWVISPARSPTGANAFVLVMRAKVAI